MSTRSAMLTGNGLSRAVWPVGPKTLLRGVLLGQSPSMSRSASSRARISADLSVLKTWGKVGHLSTDDAHLPTVRRIFGGLPDLFAQR